MALAYLLKNLDPQLLGFPVSPTALIVDHSMRSGSGPRSKEGLGLVPRVGFVRPTDGITLG